MSTRIPETLLAGYRKERPNEPAIEKAARALDRDPELRRRVDEQVEFDTQVGRAIRAIAPPEGLRQKLGGTNGSKVKGRPFAGMLVFAVIFGLSIIAGLLVLFEVDRRQRFPGSEAVARMVGTAKSMSGLELEQVSNKAGQLGDWFYMRGFESFALPPELADAPAVGSRLFRQDGNSIAQVVVDWHQSVVYVFRADEFGVDLPQNEDWRVLKYDDWAAAVRKRGPMCTLITFRGKKNEMREFLKTIEKK